MQLIAEVGSCFQPNDPMSLLDAAKAAMDLGADVVKLQVYNAEELSRRRGVEPAKLEPWALDKRFGELAQALIKARIPFGASVFGGASANAVMAYAADMKFLKTATQEYQCAALADRVSAYAVAAGIPLYVSVPEDACLVVGNYWSEKPITWLYCVPHYPAHADNYDSKQLERMMGCLPGQFGVSDHTPDKALFERFWSVFEQNIVAYERHFCYDESLRDRVPDGGPWSLNRKDFGKFAKEAKR